MSHYQLGLPGMISPLGDQPETTLTALLNQDDRGMVWRDDLRQDAPALVGQAVALDTPLTGPLARWDCRNNRMLDWCCQAIAGQVEAQIASYGADRVAVVLGTSTSGIAECEQAMLAERDKGAFPGDYHYRKQEIGTGAQFVAERLGLTGLAYIVSTACSSSAKALAAAARLLDTGMADAVVCGGCDSLSKLTINGFSALESYAAERSKPLSEGRDGINIGEASVLFVMSRNPGGVRFRGAGESSDAYHVSAPHPEGRGAEEAMRLALNQAGLMPDQVDYLNLHGTGTPLNDVMECAAVHRLFGDTVPVSSTKPLTGHTLGAAGALEAAIGWLLLSDLNPQRRLPAQWLGGPLDPQLAPVTLANEHHRLPAHGGVVVSNSFAFGGSNISLVLSREDAQ
ncbi:beta-ketoacyl-ACP synthase [Ferrimonas balearica]|uniref:beta-ketoacyl-ACP synthase n=1 Tax=Ferrimonas balearica TaxID=44012 RepID=UPI001C59134B|nr:beta-ketoacyl-ACP synthase [Ferrimonas balearica]MBW3164019.1 beta-ketoacyl-ACP synthase [Ferrimonas balearica]MBY6224001.1 beta-ketoacyl-ACP synthase [Ferrimonas balearica]